LFTQRLYDINEKWSQQWPVITEREDPLPDADSLNPAMGYTGDKTKLLDDYD